MFAALLIAATPAKHQHAKPAPDTGDDTPAPAEETSHIVRPGETLGGVAARAHVPRILIAEANGLKPPYHIHAGMRLTLPRTRHHTVADGETGFDIAYQYGVPFSAIAVANGMKPSAVLHPGQVLLIPSIIGSAKAVATPAKSDAPADTEDAPAPVPRHFLWPLAGKVTRGYVARAESPDYHDGVDIAAPAGTAVRAAGGGTVIFAGEEPQSFGRLVVIDHGSVAGGDDWQSAYGFLGKITVAKGDRVKPHERIGLVGHSGKAPRDELHFELRRGNKPVDPLPELPVRAGSRPAE